MELNNRTMSLLNKNVQKVSFLFRNRSMDFNGTIVQFLCFISGVSKIEKKSYQQFHKFFKDSFPSIDKKEQSLAKYCYIHSLIFQFHIKLKMQYKNAYKKQGFIFKTNPPHQKMPDRSIITNVPDNRVCDNSIMTSKYTVSNFLPLNLIMQFSKVANIYFVLIGIMQMIPSISVSGGFPAIFIPLSIVISVSVFKDFFEDLKRKASDRKINNMRTSVLDPGIYRDRLWRELHIGNLIKVKKDDEFPADVILLRTSDQKQSCFIETKNLDGQTNLKYRKVKPELVSALAKYKETDLGTIREKFNYEKPNPYIHSFTGSFNNVPLDNNNVVLRGCSLKIIDWVIGLVIYTGIDTKIMLNSNKTRRKKSRLQFRMGIVVAVIFFVQMLLTFSSALLSIVLTEQSASGYELMVKWGSWILLFTNFVPISLIVSLEMVKYIQGINITNSSRNGKVTVQTSTLNEELGQIQHIFSDKTGTLTCNYMSFKYMMIGNKTFGYGDKNIIPPQISHVDFHDPEFLHYLSKETITRGHNQILFDMFIQFTMCHSVIIEDDGMGNKKYNASSPDELAFINMGKFCGWEFLGIDKDNMVNVRYKDEIIRYRLLHIMEFNSVRKKMSVILEQQIQLDERVQKRIFIYSKGADNVIVEKLKESERKSSRCENLQKQLHDWSVDGLRTLVFSKREIKPEYYEKWAKMYAASLMRLEKLQKQEKKGLKSSLIKSVKENKPVVPSNKQFSIESVSRIIIDDAGQGQLPPETPTQLINKLLNDDSILTQHQKIFLQRHLRDLDKNSTATSTQLEEILQREMQLIGGTAIEDKLQDKVKETITKLRQAGIKIWMLTGDKKQTAINIGISCGIIAEDMGIVNWQENVGQTIEQRNTFPQDRDCCLVVTGDDLLSPSDEKSLLSLINSCKAIICCRVTPKQKQDMVWLMRKNRCTTLGIGDGANDVNMINTAHVGVGIKGVEGAQAAICSDYAISEFKVLGQLLLYNGRQCYRKNSQLILFTFYKNLILVLPQFWYGFYNHFSSATIYDPWIYQLYNVAYTSLPIMIYAIYDQRYNKNQSLKKPKLYQQGLKNQLFNKKSVFVHFLIPIKFSLILTHVTFNQMEGKINSEGYMFDLLSSGMCIFAQCVLICNLKVLILAFRWSIGLKLSVFLGIFVYFLTVKVANFIFPTSNMGNMIDMQIRSFEYWLVIVETVVGIILVEYAMMSWRILKQKRKKEEKKQGIQLPILESN